MTSDRRLHRAGIVIAATEDLRTSLVPLLVVGLVTGGIGSVAELLVRLIVLGAIGAAIAAFAGYIRWSTTTYRVDDAAVHFRTGVFRVNEKSIPIDRVQSLDVSQGPVQRLLGVREARVQAAGGGKDAEIALNALDDNDVAGLRTALGRTAAEALAAAGPAAPARRLTNARLLLAGVTSAQFGFLVPVAAAAGGAVDELSDPFVDWLREGHAAPSLATIALVAGTVIGAAWLAAFAGTVIGFGGFVVARRGDRLTIERGYVVRRTASVPVARIQAVRVVDGIVRQPLGMTQLRLETAGYADDRADARTLFPLMRRSEVAAFVRELLPELAVPIEQLERPPTRALRRYLFLPALVGGALGTVAAIALDAWPVAVAGAALGAAWGMLRFRAAGVALPAGALVVRSRRLARSTVVARRTSVDIRSRSQNPLQRRGRLATVRFAIASGHKFGVPHVDAGAATGALAELAPRALVDRR